MLCAIANAWRRTSKNKGSSQHQARTRTDQCGKYKEVRYTVELGDSRSHEGSRKDDDAGEKDEHDVDDGDSGSMIKPSHLREGRSRVSHDWREQSYSMNVDYIHTYSGETGWRVRDEVRPQASTLFTDKSAQESSGGDVAAYGRTCSWTLHPVTSFTGGDGMWDRRFDHLGASSAISPFRSSAALVETIIPVTGTTPDVDELQNINDRSA